MGSLGVFAEFQQVPDDRHQYVTHLGWVCEEELDACVGLIDSPGREVFVEFVLECDCIFGEEPGVDVEAERYGRSAEFGDVFGWFKSTCQADLNDISAEYPRFVIT